MRTALLLLVCAVGTLQIITSVVDAVSPVFMSGVFS